MPFTSLRPVFSRIGALEGGLVAALVAGGIVSTRLLPFAVIAALLFWIVRWLGTGMLTRRTPADWGIVLLMLMCPVTLWATAFPEITLPQIYRLLAGVGLFYALVNWATTYFRMRLALWITLAFGLALAAYALVSVDWVVDKLPFMPVSIYEWLPKFTADLVHRNVMAGSLVLLAPLAFCLFLFSGQETPWIQRYAALLISITIGGVIVLTQSRGAWVAFGVSLLLAIVLRWRWGWWIIALLGLGVAGALWIKPVEIMAAWGLADRLGGLDGRTEIWSRAIYMIQDFPFTGVGMGSFGPVADNLYPFFLAEAGTTPHAHNLLLQIAVDLGIPGLIAWLSVFLGVTAAAWKTYRQGQDAALSWLSSLGAGVLCSQFALMVHGLVDAVTWGMVRPAPLVWAIWGLGVAGAYLAAQGTCIHRNTP